MILVFGLEYIAIPISYLNNLTSLLKGFTMLAISHIAHPGMFFQCLINKIIPDRTKRLVLLASLMAELVDLKSFNKETLQKLNAVMHLCTYIDAMKLPISLSNVIWHGKTSYELFNTKDIVHADLNTAAIKTLSESIVDKVPTWLRYGDTSTIVKDIQELLRNRGMLVTM